MPTLSGTSEFAPCLVPEPRLEVDCRADRLPSRREDRQSFVSPQVDKPSIVSLDAVGDELGETGREVGCRFVAVLLRVPRVTTDVGDEEGAKRGWNVRS